MSAKKSLDDALEIYRTLSLCCAEAMELMRRGPDKFSRKFEEATDTTGRNYNGDPKRFLEHFFDQRVTPRLSEVCFLDVVGTFEFLVYELIKDASGNIKSILSDPRSTKGSQKPKFPFQSYADRFVKERREGIHKSGDLSNLADVKEILKGRLDDKLYDELDAIVTYRNWLAHGKRFSAESPRHPGNLQEVVSVLNKILIEIKG